MEIFGVGTIELIIVFVIMLMVAGPKRMIRWAYELGKVMAKMRAAWAETMSMLQKELNQAGVDVELPKEMPTRGSLNTDVRRQLGKAVAPITQPVQETLDEVNADLKPVLKPLSTGAPAQPVKTATPPSANPSPNGANTSNVNLGTWGSSPPGEDKQP